MYLHMPAASALVWQINKRIMITQNETAVTCQAADTYACCLLAGRDVRVNVIGGTQRVSGCDWPDATYEWM